MMPYIRDMKEKDIPEVQNVARKSWNHTYEGIIPLNTQENFLKTAYSDKMMLKRMEVTFLFVAEKDGNIVGFANFSRVKQGGAAELGAIYLLPDYQELGLGTALLERSIEKLGSADSIFVNVEKENKIGTSFYKAKGFEFVSEFDDNLDGHITKMIRMVWTR